MGVLREPYIRGEAVGHKQKCGDKEDATTVHQALKARRIQLFG